MNSNDDTQAKPASAPVMIRDLNDDEKPREKALKLGMESLSDVELLALLLGSGVPGKSVIDLSREILADCEGKLRLLSRMTIPELKKKYKGVGDAKATLLVAAMAFGNRVQNSLDTDDPAMTCSRDVMAYMYPRVGRLNYEEFWVLHLNRANKVMYADRVSKGGVAATAVDARLIAKAAIDHLSSAIILVHNHPSGNMRPSGQDDALTRRITEVCKIIEVPVQDHLIVGPSSNAYYSYRDNGKI